MQAFSSLDSTPLLGGATFLGAPRPRTDSECERLHRRPRVCPNIIQRFDHRYWTNANQLKGDDEWIRSKFIPITLAAFCGPAFQSQASAANAPQQNAANAQSVTLSPGKHLLPEWVCGPLTGIHLFYSKMEMLKCCPLYEQACPYLVHKQQGL
jgi:hypothetical protein